MFVFNSFSVLDTVFEFIYIGVFIVCIPMRRVFGMARNFRHTTTARLTCEFCSFCCCSCFVFDSKSCHLAFNRFSVMMILHLNFNKECWRAALFQRLSRYQCDKWLLRCLNIWFWFWRYPISCDAERQRKINSST